jgi:hypothetical protein
MKKRATVLIMLAALLFMTNGVAQVQLGLQAGANFTDVTMDPTQEGMETSSRTGFLFGGVLFYSFSPIFGLQVEPAYVQKGAAVDMSLSEGGTVQAEATLTADYFDIPVLLKASFGDGPVKPYLLGGATIGFLLGDAMLVLDKITADGEDVTNMIPEDEREEKVDVKSTDFILTLGGGIIIPLGQVNIFAEAQYNLGLSDVNDDSDDDTTIKSTGIQIKAGVLFPL